MRCRWPFAVLIVALETTLACESERPLADDLLRIDAGEEPSGGGPGSPPKEDASVTPPGDDASVPPMDGTDAGADAPDADQKR